MRWIFSVIILLAFFTYIAPSAHAIIFLPAIILIPIAKIVAVIIGGFSFPALGFGAVWSKLFGKSFKRTISVILLIIFFFALILVLFLKIQNPARPLF